MIRQAIKNMKISYKLQIPNLLYLITLAVIIAIFFHSKATMGHLNQEQQILNSFSNQMRDFAFSILDYMSKELPWEEAEKQYQSFQRSIEGTGANSQVTAKWKMIEDFRQLEVKNEAIEGDIFQLTQASMTNSNNYIRTVSNRLADAEERHTVSKIERLVLVGANINTVSNYEIRVRFLQLKEDFGAKDGLLKYINSLTANTKEDIKKLEGTPFQPMAIAALESNETIEKLAREYVNNMETQNSLHDNVLSLINTDLEKIDVNRTESAAHFIANIETILFEILMAMVAAIIICTLLSFYLARGITVVLTRISGHIDEGAGQVASASNQISSSSQQLAEGASEQAASIEETSSSLEEMSAMTRQNADNAGQADNLMKEANQVVGQANESMNDLTTSMEEISKASKETSKIIKTIDEIAFQTNLLALNAAVEAARAGEAGAGFAVVADEVRNLAMRAADAARNTADLIEATVVKVNDGSELVAKTDKAFGQVAKSTKKVGELVGEIASASGEQSEGIEQVNKAVTEMDKVIQQNAANAEESASSSEEMNAQAETMKASVGELVALVGGSLRGKDQTSAGSLNPVPYNTHQGQIEKTERKEFQVHKQKEICPDEVVSIGDGFAF
jgi:methyl-accepting chemotaxis protein